MYDDVARRAQRGGGGALTALTPVMCQGGKLSQASSPATPYFWQSLPWGGGVKWSFTPTTHPTVLGTADPAA